MDARTRSVLTGDPFPVVYGEPAIAPHPFVVQLQQERTALREIASEAERYAISLREENALLRRSTEDAAAYARSLEQEVAQLRQMREQADAYAKSLESELAHRPPAPRRLSGWYAKLADRVRAG